MNVLTDVAMSEEQSFEVQRCSRTALYLLARCSAKYSDDAEKAVGGLHSRVASLT